MSRSKVFSGFIVVAVALIALAVTLRGDPPAVRGAFPGANGQIAFVSDRDDPGNSDIYAVSPDGTGLVRLTTDPGGDFDPAWSPDGSEVAFRCESEVCVMNADGSGRTVISTSGGQEPAWSPDGSKIAFGCTSQICVMNADGSGLAVVGGGQHPAWSPDGSKMALGSGGGIYTMNADGSGRAVLFDSPGFESYPAWSPDGTKVALNSGGSGIAIINADGSGLTLLNTGITGRLDWSPDGSKLVFDGYDYPNSGNVEIWLVDADDITGVSKIKLTDYPGSDNSPTWQRLLQSTPTPTPSPTTPADTPTPVATPTPGAAAWRHTCYLGAAEPIEQALPGVAGDVLAVYRLSATQTFDRWFPDRPEVSNITTVSPYQPLFVLMANGATWLQTPSGAPPASAGLVQGWNSVCYAGDTKSAPDATAGMAGAFSILYRLGSDQTWGRLLPGRPELSSVTQLNQYDSLLVLVTQAGGAAWAFNP